MSQEFSWGLIFGFFTAFIISTLFNHALESECQHKQDVADCMWVLVPTPQEK